MSIPHNGMGNNLWKPSTWWMFGKSKKGNLEQAIHSAIYCSAL